MRGRLLFGRLLCMIVQEVLKRAGERRIMALQLIAGPSGAGKSHWIYKKLIEESGKHPKRTYLLVVPEQFSIFSVFKGWLTGSSMRWAET